MKKSRTAYAARNLAYGMVNKILMLLVPFLLLAVIRRTLGSEYLGLNNLFASLIQMLSLAEMGLGSAMVYSMYKPVAENNVEQLDALLRLYRNIYRVLSIFILLVGMICVPFLTKIIKDSVPEDTNLYLLFLIYLLNTVLSYGLFAYKKSLLQAYQRTDIVSKISTVVHVGLYAMQLLSLLVYRSYYLYVLLLPLSTVANNLLVNYVCSKRYAGIKPEGEIEERAKRDLFSRVGALAGHKIGGIVISSFDSVVISAFLGLRSVALYSNYFYVVKALTGIINIGYSSILPGIGNSIILEDKEHNYALYRKVSFLLMWFVGWASVCLVCLYQPFVTLWMGKEYLLGWDTVLLFVIYFYVWQIRVANLAFKDATGLWKDDFWKPYVGLFVNLFVNILLVKLIGMNGVLITTIFVMVAIYNPWEQWVLFTKLFQCSAMESVRVHVFHVVFTVIAAGVTYGVCLLFTATNQFVALLLRACICVVIPNILFFVFYHKKEECKYMMHILEKALDNMKGKQNENT